MTLLISASAFGASDPIAPQLRAQLEKARPELGNLQSWQEEIFLAEVLPAAGRFVKDYSSRGGILTRVEVDFEGIRKYLGFHADQVFKSGKKVLLAVRASNDCTPCVGAVPFIRKNLSQRLERRGFTVDVLSAADAGQDLTELLPQRSAVGWVMSSVKSVPDADHPGDTKNELMVEFRFPGTPLARVQKQMEILPTDSIEVSMGRMAVDGITEMGGKVRQARLGALEAGGSEGVEIIVSGFRTFTQLQAMKKSLQAHFQNSARVIERRLERGKSTLSVVGDVNAAEVVKALEAAQIPQMTLRVVSNQKDSVEVAAVPKGASS